MNLVALHGFFGVATDWQKILHVLEPTKMWTPNLFQSDSKWLTKDFAHFTAAALQEIDRRFGSDPVVLVGYSLGGRLALHLALKEPKRFENVILLSTHMGVENQPQASERQNWEAGWSHKIDQLPWSDLQGEWNSQSLFSGDEEPLRRENEFSKPLLKNALTSFSNTKHEFNRGDLTQYPGRLTWAMGEHDQKFRDHLAEVQEVRGNKDRYLVVPKVGHRLIFAKNTTWIASCLERGNQAR